MKKNREFINLGEFEMTSPVMRVSDPCYERDVWCCGTVDHCKLGTWEAGVLKTDEGEWAHAVPSLPSVIRILVQISM